MAPEADQSSREARFRAAAASGAFTVAEQLVGELAADSASARAFALELTAARWIAGQPAGRLPSPAQLDAALEASTASTLARVAAFGARAAVLRFDGDALGTWHGWLERLAATASAPEVLLRLLAVRAWRSLFAGDHDDAARAAGEAGALARSEGIGDAVVELQALGALTALGAGRPDEATAAARRAFRMARSESIPPHEFLANLVLARVRRVTGAPHLASRILGVLRDLASAPFLAWLDYELGLAGGRVSPEAAGAGAALARFVDALPDREADLDVGALRKSVAGFRDLRVEVEDLLAAVGVGAGGSPRMQDWLTGRAHPVPRGLHALSSAEDSVPAVAYVLASPGEPATRLLSLGLARAARAQGVHRIEPGRRPQERTDAAIACLAMRPDAVDERAFFQELYGFAYRPELHGSVLSTLVHRVRATVAGAATLHRERGMLRLELTAPLVAWDPRCQRPLEDRILGVLTQTGAATAKRTADLLGIPLRTVQAALGQLVEAGACKRDRQGRNIEYTVEDTTFSEPTLTRARAWRGDIVASG